MPIHDSMPIQYTHHSMPTNLHTVACTHSSMPAQYTHTAGLHMHKHCSMPTDTHITINALSASLKLFHKQHNTQRHYHAFENKIAAQLLRYQRRTPPVHQIL